MGKLIGGAVLLWSTLAIAAIGGYVANVYKLLTYMDTISDKMFIVRGIGVFFPPFGAIVGYL